MIQYIKNDFLCQYHPTKKGSFIVPIGTDMLLIRIKINNKTVNTIVTMPQWLKDEAKKNKIKFSQLLQEALKEKLNI